MRTSQSYLTPDEVIAVLKAVRERCARDWAMVLVAYRRRWQRQPGAGKAGARTASYFQHNDVRWDVGSAGVGGRRRSYDGDVY
jgi:hypothetical protein